MISLNIQFHRVQFCSLMKMNTKGKGDWTDCTDREMLKIKIFLFGAKRPLQLLQSLRPLLVTAYLTFQIPYNSHRNFSSGFARLVVDVVQAKQLIHDYFICDILQHTFRKSSILAFLMPLPLCQSGCENNKMSQLYDEYRLKMLQF